MNILKIYILLSYLIDAKMDLFLILSLKKPIEFKNMLLYKTSLETGKIGFQGRSAQPLQRL